MTTDATTSATAAATAAATTTTAAAATTAAATTTTAAAAPAWHGYTEPADVAWVANKGWQTAADAVRSARESERFLGRDPNSLLVIPKADDADGRRAVLTRLGLPESGAKYEFSKPPEGLKEDAGYVNFARDAFHKVGLLPDQAKALTAAHNEYVKGVLDQQTKDYGISVAADKKALLTEWGAGHERKMAAASSAAKALGFSEAMIDAIEGQVGYAGAWKFFADLGQKMGEDGFVSAASGGARPATGMMTPDEARAEWGKMAADPEVVKSLADKWHPKNAENSKKQAALFAVMYPEKS